MSALEWVAIAWGAWNLGLLAYFVRSIWLRRREAQRQRVWRETFGARERVGFRWPEDSPRLVNEKSARVSDLTGRMTHGGKP